MKYLKKWNALWEKDFTLLQMEQVFLGAENGLSMDQIYLYATGEYNFKQMKVIREAIENQKDVKKILDSNLDAETMRMIIEGKADPPKKFAFPYPIAFAIVLIAFLLPLKDNPSIDLKQDIVNIETGEVFRAYDYIQHVSGKNPILYLPNDVDTSKAGSYVMVYRLKTEDGEVSESLVLNVLDP